MKKIAIFLLIFTTALTVSASESQKLNRTINNSHLQAACEIDNSGNSTDQIKSADEIPVPIKKSKRNSPGKISSFWWAFVLSAIGSYTIYGIAAGPISVLVVYLSSKGSKTEVRKAIWGWITGTVLGLGIWALVKLV